MRVVDGKWPRWGADAGLVVLAFAPPLLSQPYVDTSGPAWSALIGYEAVTAVMVLLRRRLPATAFVLGFGALVAALVGGAAEGAKLTPMAFVPLAVLLYSLGSLCTSWARTVSVLLGCGGAISLLGLWANRMTAEASEFQGRLDVLAALAPMLLAWAMGFASRSRRALLAAAEQRAAEASRAQRLEAAQATQRERARIAREMHDVVAHSLTLLVVHAETLRARGDELPDWARTQIDGLAAAGRQSGGELRDLLRVLRDPAEAAPLQPVPGLGELDALLDSHRAAGGTVEVRKGTPGTALESLPAPVQTAGYRIVQEALSNARRHAPGAPVRLLVDGAAGRLRCEVENSRGARRGTAGAGIGLGLVSMRERVDALGGRLTAGPTGDGGFRVVATMPLEKERA
ncbi:sensor histidine kinase [Streptomyces iconiensis]|uniref:histidine kinase n=1 Tax=Streptomyces iconiensis TaxID=1384038 RepID=A0ABT7A7Y5_9ACTN|nr:histidine kinase [Streptomyces iconiensis]MDJ1137438.1 histidine kinase [Streptomyces iconiensis]